MSDYFYSLETLVRVGTFDRGLSIWVQLYLAQAIADENNQ